MVHLPSDSLWEACQAGLSYGSQCALAQTQNCLFYITWKSHKRIKTNVPSDLGTRIQLTYNMYFMYFSTLFSANNSKFISNTLYWLYCAAWWHLKIALIRHHFKRQIPPFLFFPSSFITQLFHRHLCGLYFDHVEESLNHHSHSYIQLKKYQVDLHSFCSFWAHKRKFSLFIDAFWC